MFFRHCDPEIYTGQASTIRRSAADWDYSFQISRTLSQRRRSKTNAAENLPITILFLAARKPALATSGNDLAQAHNKAQRILSGAEIFSSYEHAHTL